MAKFKASIDEKEIREDVKINLPKHWLLRVFKVVSGDSGKEYWVQYMREANETRRPSDGYVGEIMICNCPEGYFKSPLSILAMRDFWCKHSKDVYETVIKKGGK